MLEDIHNFYYESVNNLLNNTTYKVYMVMKFHCNFMDIYKSFNILANLKGNISRVHLKKIHFVLQILKALKR